MQFGFGQQAAQRETNVHGVPGYDRQPLFGHESAETGRGPLKPIEGGQRGRAVPAQQRQHV